MYPALLLVWFYLTLNRPGFTESGKAGGGGTITMKFSDVLLCQELDQEMIKYLITS